MLPFVIEKGELPFKNGDYLFVPDVRRAVEEKATLQMGELTDDERTIILKGCLINYYKG